MGFENTDNCVPDFEFRGLAEFEGEVVAVITNNTVGADGKSGIYNAEALNGLFDNDDVSFGMKVASGEALGAITEQQQSPQELQQIAGVNDFKLPDGQRLGDTAAGIQEHDFPDSDVPGAPIRTICNPVGV